MKNELTILVKTEIFATTLNCRTSVGDGICEHIGRENIPAENIGYNLINYHTFFAVTRDKIQNYYVNVKRDEFPHRNKHGTSILRI